MTTELLSNMRLIRLQIKSMSLMSTLRIMFRKGLKGGCNNMIRATKSFSIVDRRNVGRRPEVNLWGYPGLVELCDSVFVLITEANIRRGHCGSFYLMVMTVIGIRLVWLIKAGRRGDMGFSLEGAHYRNSV